MSLAIVSNLTVCPQCGEDWTASVRYRRTGGRLEFCPRCGSPVAGLGFDPLRAPVYGASMTKVNRRAKFIVRSGVLGIGVVGFFTGILLCYGGWINPGALDAVQLWVSRVGGPLLLIQGLFYSWLPFRQPVGATILRFTPRS